MGTHRSQQHLNVLTLVGDSASILISFSLAYVMRFHSFERLQHTPSYFTYAAALTVIIPVYLIIFRAYGLYQTTRHLRRIEEIFLVIKAITLAVLLLTAMTFFYREFSYSRLFLVYLWIFSILMTGAVRYFMIQLEYARKRSRREVTKMLVIGANRNGRSIIEWAKSNLHYGYQILGVLTREAALVGKHFEGVPIIGIVDQARSFIETLKPDQVVLLDKDATREQMTQLVLLCEDKMVDFKIGADFYGLMSRNVEVEYLSNVPLLGFRALPLDDPWNRVVKRSFDIFVTLILLTLTAPLWIVLAILIKMDDGGPVLYKQERMGRDMKVFDVLKFRTMRVNAEKESGPVWAKADDQRRTRTGEFLRRWNLDELPQLFNVLKGDMSLVGPRPERPHFIEQFRDDIPRYMARHRIKSGLTGWAAVNGYRGNTSILERTKYDLYYMENWSLIFDLEILFMTLFAFKNAY